MFGPKRERERERERNREITQAWAEILCILSKKVCEVRLGSIYGHKKISNVFVLGTECK